jgi:hypothetical protein
MARRGWGSHLNKGVAGWRAAMRVRDAKDFGDVAAGGWGGDDGYASWGM